MTAVTLLLFVIVLIGLLYIPFVQDFVVPQVLSMVNSEDMTINVEKFRLKFPLDINVRGLEIMQHGDTMLMAGNARVDVKLLPILKGDIVAREIELKEIYYKSGTPDSSTCIRANIKDVSLMNPGVNLSDQKIGIDNLSLNGGKVRIALRNDTTSQTKDSEPTKWHISANKINLTDLDYEMTMDGNVIGAQLGSFNLAKADMNLGSQHVNISDIVISSVDASYILPSSAAPDTVTPAASADTTAAPSLPWTIEVGHLLLDKSKALYATQGAKPQTGLDMQFIAADHITVEVDSFYNHASTMRIPLKRLTAVERSGLKLYGSGTFAMNDSAIDATSFSLRTMASSFDFDAHYATAGGSNAPLYVKLRGEIAPIDIVTAAPVMKPTIDMLPHDRKLTLTADASGSLADLKVTRIEAAMRNYFDIKAKGYIANLTDFNNAHGHIDIDGDMQNVNFIKPAIMDAKLGRTTTLPPLKLLGDIDIDRGTIDGNVQALTHEGKLALEAMWNSRQEGYDIDIDTEHFPIGTFLPGMGLGDITATVQAKGRGYNPMSRRSDIYAAINLADAQYRGNHIHDLQLMANVTGGEATVSLASSNGVIDGQLHASGNLAGDAYSWTLSSDMKHVDLYALGVTDTVSTLEASIAGKMMYAPRNKEISADINIPAINLKMGKEHIATKDIYLLFDGTDSTTEATLRNLDMALRFKSPAMADTIAARLGKVSAAASPMIEARNIDIEQLQRDLPPFSIYFEAGNNNMVHNYLAQSGSAFDHIRLSASNDSIIRVKAGADTVISGASRFDRIDFEAHQQGNKLLYNLMIDNKPGTLDNFAHVKAMGFIGGNEVKVEVEQQNIKDATGYHLGALAEFTDSTLRLSFDTVNPVIGYKDWTINPDNFISFNTRSYHLDANLMIANKDSRLHLFTNHDEENDGEHQEDIRVDIDNIQIADWMAVSPYAPPMRGALSSQMRFALAPGTINGEGTVTLADFTYNKKRVGTVDMLVDVTTSRTGAITAATNMKIDGREVLTANGALNDTTLSQPFMLDMKLTKFPLNIANPFIGSTAQLDGYLSGNMDVTRSIAEPLFNGYLDFDSATAKVNMIGTTFRFSEEKLPVDSNVINFNRYAIYGVNDNPLTIDGKIDMRSLSDINLDLALNADNMQVVGGNKRRGTDVYGKAFISLDANARGNLHFINARANVTVNEGTNVTYIIPTASSQLTQQSEGDMVHFVNFSDTTAVAKADSVAPPSTMINLTAILNVAQGSVIGVDLSSSGHDRVQVLSNGTLDFSMNPMGDTRTTGRLNINGGYVRYTPPLMSEKLFDFQEGSYVAFNGDMANPILNVKAIDVIKANVTQEGQNSRLVNFDVILDVKGTLNEMNVAFDLATNEDITVQNELQSMSAEQRANQAMNLLLYNVYTGPGTKGNANISGNPLYSFLSSTINSWMANNVKGVDISFGIDQYERTLDGAQSTTTSYSYRVSKSFLDDRFKVVVGGNYSTDANADENLSQNLINDISFEYLLNKQGTMYIRLFRHTGYESILEGELTQTGVGFVYKRKLRTLRNMFRRSKPASALPQQGAAFTTGDMPRSGSAPAGCNDTNATQSQEAIKPQDPDVKK